jgi:hypothetical protein
MKEGRRKEVEDKTLHSHVAGVAENGLGPDAFDMINVVIYVQYTTLVTTDNIEHHRSFSQRPTRSYSETDRERIENEDFLFIIIPGPPALLAHNGNRFTGSMSRGAKLEVQDPNR